MPSNRKGLRDIDYNPEYFAKQGIKVGYENPAFEAPVDFSRCLVQLYVRIALHQQEV